jgi:hypothetical protein
MQTYYQFTNFFNTICLAHPNITTFTVGDLQGVDTSKETLFPLAHLIINNVTVSNARFVYNVNLLIMDRVMDIVPTSTGIYNTITKDFKTITNMIDVHNSTLLTSNDLLSYMYKNAQANQYTIVTDAVVTPFEERFVNLVAGWSTVIDITVPNYQDSCVLNLDINLANGGENVC